MQRIEKLRNADFTSDQQLPTPSTISVVDYHFLGYTSERKQKLVESILKKQRKEDIEPPTDEEIAFMQWQSKNY